MRTAAEIEALRLEAARMLRAAVTTKKLREIAQRESDALRDVLDAMTERRAVELGCSSDDLSVSDILVTADDRAIARAYGRATLAANIVEQVDETDTVDHVVARLAIERGWNVIDAARAILANADAKVDEIRSGADHAKAKRVKTAVRNVARTQLRNIEGQLRMLGEGSRMDAAGVLPPAAFLSAISKTEISFENVVAALHASRDKLAAFLERGGRK